MSPLFRPEPMSKRVNPNPSFVFDLMDHYTAIRKLIVANYTATVDKEQALIRLAESEMWLGNARMKVEGPHAKQSPGG